MREREGGREESVYVWYVYYGYLTECAVWYCGMGVYITIRYILRTQYVAA